MRRGTCCGTEHTEEKILDNGIKEYKEIDQKFANLRLARKYNLPEWQDFKKTKEFKEKMKEAEKNKES